MRILPPAAFLLATAAATGARAVPTHMDIPGTSLTIETSCAARVTIAPDGAPGRVSLDATADHREELDQLDFAPAGSAARLELRGHSCWPDSDWSFRRSLAITLHVAPGTPLDISDSGGVAYEVGAVGGKLHVDLSGGVEFAAAAAADTNLEASGGVHLRLAAIKGSLTADLSGGVVLRIAQIDAPSATIDASGGVQAEIAGGSIARLKAETSGGVSLHAAVTAGDADVEASGGADIRIARVTGQLTKDASGGGDISIGQ